MTEPRRAVITGIGLVTAAGGDVASFWRTLLDGRSCAGPIRRFDVSGYPSRIAAEVSDADLDRTPLPPRWDGCGRLARLAAAAAARAVEDAGGAIACAPDRAGVSLATGISTWDHAEVIHACTGAARSRREEDVDLRAVAEGLRRDLRPDARARLTPGSIPVAIAADYGLTGPAMSVMTACAGGTQAIGDAARWIRSGRADTVIAGGADCEITPMGLASFCLLGALSRRNDDPAAASRPFDAGRDGFVLGEGAAVIVLEERAHALARGARIYAEVAGFGGAADAYRVTDPHPDGTGAVLAMTRAIADAGCTPDDIGYVNAHGTSTLANDRAETIALKRLFGGRAMRVPVSSTKSMIGHATVAAGAIEAVATALTLRDQIVHPTINHDTRDPECDLDYVPNVRRRTQVRWALSNSFAFGGQTAALVLRQHAG